MAEENHGHNPFASFLLPPVSGKSITFNGGQAGGGGRFWQMIRVVALTYLSNHAFIWAHVFHMFKVKPYIPEQIISSLRSNWEGTLDGVGKGYLVNFNLKKVTAPFEKPNTWYIDKSYEQYIRCGWRVEWVSSAFKHIFTLFAYSLEFKVLEGEGIH